MELPILYEDQDIVAVNKPAGLVTHSDGRTKEETAEEWFKEKYPEVTVEHPYTHRLDRDTSGALVFAKTPEAHEFLRRAFTNREVKKTYLAFVYGVPKEKEGSIDFDIGRSSRDFRLRSAQPKAKGRLREAITRYEVLGEAGGYVLLKVMPETGRTHQIRVHLKAIHHPIVGDSLYAPNHPAALGIHRLGLHAYEIDLPLPRETKTISVSGMIYHTSSPPHVHIVAPVPADLASALAHFPNAKEKFALA